MISESGILNLSLITCVLIFDAKILNLTLFEPGLATKVTVSNVAIPEDTFC